MTRRSALHASGDAAADNPSERLDDRSPLPSYPRKPRGRAPHRVRRLVREVIEFAFETCESEACAQSPDGICMRCGTVRCAAHAAPARDGRRRCSDCGGVVDDLLTAPIEVVLDARLRER
jgi:hypothetical protein